LNTTNKQERESWKKGNGEKVPHDRAMSSISSSVTGFFENKIEKNKIKNTSKTLQNLVRDPCGLFGVCGRGLGLRNSDPVASAPQWLTLRG
jgi:hypothetical protein